MTLDEIESGGRAVPLALIGADSVLTRQVQDRLAAHRLLDPPADGSFGPVSLWAMAQFLRKAQTAGKTTLDAEAAGALLSDEPLFPLRTPDSIAGRIVRAMQAAGHWFCCHPDCINIVYIEGMDADGELNIDLPNEFNDLRLVLRVNRAGSTRSSTSSILAARPASPSASTKRGRSALICLAGRAPTRRSCRPRPFVCTATSTRTSSERAIRCSTACLGSISTGALIYPDPTSAVPAPDVLLVAPRPVTVPSWPCAGLIRAMARTTAIAS